MKKNSCILFIVSMLIISSNCSRNIEEQGYIYTVSGKIAVSDLGMTLSHEHILVDFIGAESIGQPKYDEDYAIKIVLPYLNSLKEKGIKTIIECTPNYIGRDVKLLKRLSELSELNIVTNTGYYAAVDKKYLPAHVFTEDVESIAKRWKSEWEEGIDGTGIRPGFIKLGVGRGELDSIEVKLLRAAVIVSKESGLAIAMHTGDGVAARSEYNIIDKEGLNANKMIWVHAQNGSDEDRISLAERGVWISLDGISELRMEEYLNNLESLKKNNLLSKVLISHDDGWSVEKNEGKVEFVLFKNGNSQPYQTIFSKFVNELYEIGFTQEEVDMILIENPGKAFGIIN